jgi:hypothetical protein
METFDMFRTLKVLAAVVVFQLIAGATFAQRPRSVTQDSSDPSTSATASAPETVKAKYEGGVFGYNKKMNGTLNFDDGNQRLLFRDKEGKEVLFVPYNAITGAFADTKAVQPAAATVASHIPYVGLPASLIKTKVRYLTLQYSDPDTKVAGVTSFKLDTKELLDTVLQAVAGKAGLTRRGEVFVKKTS